MRFHGYVIVAVLLLAAPVYAQSIVSHESGSTDGDVLPMTKGLGDERAVTERVAAENGPRLLRQQGAIYTPIADEEAKPLRLKPAAGSEPAHSHFPEYVVVAANAADLGSTIYALHHGAHEANPMLGSQIATIAPLKVLGAAAQVLTVRRLKASGHPTAAKITTVFIGSLYLALSVHNVKVGSR